MFIGKVFYKGPIKFFVVYLFGIRPIFNYDLTEGKVGM